MKRTDKGTAPCVYELMAWWHLDESKRVLAAPPREQHERAYYNLMKLCPCLKDPT